MEKKKIPPLAVKQLASVIASNDASNPNYLKGPELVKMFNSLGFPDSYTFVEGRGIQTSDFGEGLSRINYTLKRLEKLNNSYRIPEVCEAFVQFANQKDNAVAAIQKALEPFSNMIPQWGQSIGKITSQNGKQTADINDEVQNLSVKSDLNKEVDTLDQEKKALENSILGEIPDGVKVVFLSYSWDSVMHREWVAKLANDLTSQGIYVLFDGYNDDGTSIGQFMELGIQRADKVLVIGTTNYMKKYNSVSTGVGFEGYIIRAYIIQSIGTKKIIPCLREGDFKLSFPMTLGDRKGHDFKDDKKYKEELDDLCREIWERPKFVRPVLGAIPDYV